MKEQNLKMKEEKNYQKPENNLAPLPTYSNNLNSSSGLAEDLIRSMIQMCVAEMHAKTILEKRISEMEHGIIDVTDKDILGKQLDAIKTLKSELVEYAERRRADMLHLFNMFGGIGDKEQWCMVKHLGIAMMTAFECWQASDNNPELLNSAMQKNALFIKAVTKFLGVEITACASCFSDILKGEKAQEKN